MSGSVFGRSKTLFISWIKRRPGRDAAEGVEDHQAKKAIEGRVRCWPKVSALIITKQAKAIFRFPIGIFFVPAKLSIGMSRER